jgi:hypothetical protein
VAILGLAPREPELAPPLRIHGREHGDVVERRRLPPLSSFESVDCDVLA